MAILTNSLGVGHFGAYVLVLAYVEIVNRLFNVQTWEAIIKYGSEAIEAHNPRLLAHTIKASALIDVTSMVAATAVAWWCAPLFLRFCGLSAEILPATRVMCLSILAYLAEVSIGVFRIYGRFDLQARINIIVAASQVVLFGVIAMLRPSLDGFVYATVAATAVGLLSKSYYLLGILDREIGIWRIALTRLNVAELKKSGLFRFVLFRNVDVSIRMISRQIDIVVLGRFFPVGVVGVYRIAVHLANVLGKLADPLYQSMYPEVARLLASRRFNAAMRLGWRIGSYLAVASVVFYLGYAVVGRNLTTLVFGNEFAESYYVCLVYLIAVIMAFVSSPLFAFQLGFGQTRNMMNNQVLSTGLYLLVLFGLVPALGPYGAALAYVMYYVAIVGLTLANVRRCFGETV